MKEILANSGRCFTVDRIRDDIIFIKKLAILIGVATPLGLTIAYSLNNIASKKSSRAAAEVRKGITHFLAVLSSQNFRTSVIMSDGEVIMSDGD